LADAGAAGDGASALLVKRRSVAETAMKHRRAWAAAQRASQQAEADALGQPRLWHLQRLPEAFHKRTRDCLPVLHFQGGCKALVETFASNFWDVLMMQGADEE
jgi:hypothetical protein